MTATEEDLERETGIEPATFSLGSGIGYIFSRAYPAFFEIHEPIEPAICKARKNLDQIWTKVLQTFFIIRNPQHSCWFCAIDLQFGPTLVRPPASPEWAGRRMSSGCCGDEALEFQRGIDWQKSFESAERQSMAHPLVYGIDAIGTRFRGLGDRSGLFTEIFGQIRSNWTTNRMEARWPSQSNWILRTAPKYTDHPTQRPEVQLQKNIAIIFENEGWGNSIPTASGLINAGGRQMDIDLGHRITGGFVFIELKIQSNNPYDAAVQMLRYGATYLLYRLEPELASRFRGNEMLNARRIVLEVLAPDRYYRTADIDLSELEAQCDHQVRKLAAECVGELDLSFRFAAFPPNFVFKPGMDRALIRAAVMGRRSPFRRLEEEPESHPVTAGNARE